MKKLSALQAAMIETAVSHYSAQSKKEIREIERSGCTPAMTEAFIDQQLAEAMQVVKAMTTGWVHIKDIK
jgi:hypothetical protein